MLNGGNDATTVTQTYNDRDESIYLELFSCVSTLIT